MTHLQNLLQLANHKNSAEPSSPPLLMKVKWIFSPLYQVERANRMGTDVP
jgi:hypothetical protein